MQVPEDNTLYPALSAERVQQVTANFGYSPFRYCTARLARVICSITVSHSVIINKPVFSHSRYPLPEGYLPVAALSPDTLAAVQELHPALLGLNVPNTSRQYLLFFFFFLVSSPSLVSEGGGRVSASLGGAVGLHRPAEGPA